jgi:flagellar hook-associated protein 2
MAGMSLSTGLISGMDTGTIITQLMQVEANPQTLLKTQLNTTGSKTTAYQTLNSKFDALKAAADALQADATWTAAKASASTTSVSAAAGTAATTGSLTFNVDTVAATHTVISNQTWTMTGTQTPATVGFGSNSLDITVAGVTTNLALDTNADGTATLAEAVAAINAKTSLGLTASAVQTSTGAYRLQVTANKSGATAANFQVGAAGTYGIVTQGVDAQLTVGTGAAKYQVTSPTNTFTGLLNDTTVTVSAPATGVTVTVASDPAAITAKVQSFVDAANAALGSITAYTSSSSKAAVLKGDSALRTLSSQILDAVSSAVGGSSSAVAGLQLSKSGSLEFKANTFNAELATDPALVKKIFTGASANDGVDGIAGNTDDVPAATGMAAKLSALAAAATDDTTGTITLLSSSNTTKAKDLQSRIDDWDIRLALRKQTLTRQFTAMETALGSLQNQSSWLSSQIGSLPSWSASNKS